jgi:hypothetical protein
LPIIFNNASVGYIYNNASVGYVYNNASVGYIYNNASVGYIYKDPNTDNKETRRVHMLACMCGVVQCDTYRWNHT